MTPSPEIPRSNSKPERAEKRQLESSQPDMTPNPEIPKTNSKPERVGKRQVESQPTTQTLAKRRKSDEFAIESLSSGFQTKPLTVNVAWKSEVKSWNRPPSTGRWFAILGEDSTAEVRITAYTEQCDKFHATIEENQTITITNFDCRLANEKYNITGNPLEIVLTKTSQISVARDPQKINRTPMYTSLRELQNSPPNRILNVCGVITGIGQLIPLTSRKTDQKLQKREVVIMDETGAVATLTLWNEDVRKIDNKVNTVVSVIRAKTSTYRDVVSLYLTDATQIRYDLPHTRSQEIKRWWTAKTAPKPPTIIQDTTFDNMTRQNTTIFWNTVKITAIVNQGSITYKGCMKPSCNKKLTPQGDGQWFCATCRICYVDFKWILKIRMIVTDATKDMWCSAFGNVCCNHHPFSIRCVSKQSKNRTIENRQSKPFVAGSGENTWRGDKYGRELF